MFVPFITPRPRRLDRRKGGGGGGKSGGASGGAAKGGAGGAGGSGGGKSTSVSAGGTSKSATSYGGGGGPTAPIPAGQLFAGRSAGGGTRDQVYGSSQYGSGYPGVSGRGVIGRPFPFFFWPIAWGGVAGIGTAAYLHNNEYGRPDNSSRPGGVIMTAAFVSNSTNNTFRVIADNATVTDLISDVAANCSASLGSSSSQSPSSFNDSSPLPPKPEQAIQYYRASSVALTLDGYNNTAALADEGTPDTPLPSNLDMTLLNCLNSTIGLAVPLINGAGPRWTSPNLGLAALIWVLWQSLSSLI